MGPVSVRPATLADAAAITAVHCSHVTSWRRDGTGEPVAYETLSLHERWLHGGPWMSVETCAVHLNRWLLTGHLAWVAERGGEVVGEAEFVENREPAPYGPVLHLSLLFVHAAHQGEGVGRALVEAGCQLARQRGYVALTTQPEREAESFYAKVGFQPWLRLGEWQAPAVEGPLALEPEPAPGEAYPEDAGLVLRVGRYQCGRQAWDDLPFYLALAQQAHLAWGRWRVDLADSETVWLGLRAQPLAPAQTDGLIWTRPGAALQPAVEVLQGLAARLGFAYVDLLLEQPEGAMLARALGLEFQAHLTLWRREVGVQPEAL